MTLAARLGQATVIVIIVACLLYGAHRYVRRRVTVMEQRRRDFLDHLRRLQEP